MQVGGTVDDVCGSTQDAAVIHVKSVTTLGCVQVRVRPPGRGAYLPILWTTQSCWQRGQRLFCFTHRDMQQLWKEWLHSPHTTERQRSGNIGSEAIKQYKGYTDHSSITIFTIMVNKQIQFCFNLFQKAHHLASTMCFSSVKQDTGTVRFFLNYFLKLPYHYYYYYETTSNLSIQLQVKVLLTKKKFKLK